MAVRSPYLRNGNFYIAKTASLLWINPSSSGGHCMYQKTIYTRPQSPTGWEGYVFFVVTNDFFFLWELFLCNHNTTLKSLLEFMILARVAVLSIDIYIYLGFWCSTHPFMMWCTAKLGSLKLAWLCRKITLQWDILITSLTFMMLETEYPGFGGQYHSYWCPGSKSWQSISRHSTGCVGQTTCIVVLEFILYTWVKPNPRYDLKCEYTFGYF